MRFFILAALMLMSVDGQAACKWEVKGELHVKDNVFAEYGTTTKRSLAGAKVTIWASLFKNRGFARWKSTTVTARGHFKINGKPHLRDPINCARKRYFKVKVAFTHEKALIGSVGHAPHAFTVKTTTRARGRMRRGKYRVKVPAITLTSGRAPIASHLIGSRYHAAKSAMMFAAYVRLFNHLTGTESG